MNLNIYLSLILPSQKRKLLFLFWNRPRLSPELCEGICCRNGVCTAHEAQAAQVLPKKMPPGGGRMARLSDWLPFVTRPRAFGCWLDRSRAADGGWGGGLMPPHFPLPNGSFSLLLRPSTHSLNPLPKDSHLFCCAGLADDKIYKQHRWRAAVE